MAMMCGNTLRYGELSVVLGIRANKGAPRTNRPQPCAASAFQTKTCQHDIDFLLLYPPSELEITRGPKYMHQLPNPNALSPLTGKHGVCLCASPRCVGRGPSVGCTDYLAVIRDAFFLWCIIFQATRYPRLSTCMAVHSCSRRLVSFSVTEHGAGAWPGGALQGGTFRQNVSPQSRFSPAVVPARTPAPARIKMLVSFIQVYPYRLVLGSPRLSGEVLVLTGLIHRPLFPGKNACCETSPTWSHRIFLIYLVLEPSAAPIPKNHIPLPRGDPQSCFRFVMYGAASESSQPPSGSKGEWRSQNYTSAESFPPRL